jgi:hypothetical protein
MASSTFSGPVRSQNGFQEWDGTAWVPVAGGGGGGTTVVELTTDNVYSENYINDPPIGPSAGTIITLPIVGVGETITIRLTAGTTFFAWAIELPAIPGTDLATFLGTYSAKVFNNNSPVRVSSAAYALELSAPNDTLYLYDQLIADTVFTRLPNIVVPGFGTIAIFQQSVAGSVVSGVPTQFADPTVYPWVNIVTP